MTTIPPGKEMSEAASGFPVGGRPQEWRALEEAAAFEKWFDQPRQSHEPEQSRAPAGSNAAIEGTPDPLPRRSMPGATAGHVTHESRRIDAAPATVRNSDAISLAKEAGSQGPVAVASQGMCVQAGGPDAARSEAGAPVGRSSSAALHQWSKTALTAVVDDQKVRLWVRDYHLTSREMELLQKGLLEELRRLGYRLAQLVVNGETHYAQMAEPGPARAER